MKIQLIRNQRADFYTSPPGNFDEKFPFQEFVCPVIVEECKNEASANLFIERIRAVALDRQFKVSFKIPDLKKHPRRRLMDVTISSSILNELHWLLYRGNKNEKLKLSFSARFLQNGPAIDILEMDQCKLADEMDNVSVHHQKYERRNVKIPPGLIECQLINPIGNLPRYLLEDIGSWFVTMNLFVEIGPNEYFPVDGLLSSVMKLNQSIFNNKETCDMTIIPGEGSAVPCHKIFLTGNVPHFERIFQSECKESQTNSVEIIDMSEEGVIALLEYLYFRGLEKPKEDSHIALEMFQAAEKYELEELKEALSFMFLMTKNERFDLDVALYLYLYVRNLEGVDNLKDKIWEIIKLREHDLSKSVLYKDPSFSKEVCLELFTLTLGKRKRKEEVAHHSKRISR